MIEDYTGIVPLWKFSNLSEMDEIAHFVTGRKGGVSTGEKASLNLGTHVQDEPGNVQDNLSRLAATLGIEVQSIIIPRQTHSDTIAILENTTPMLLDNTDGILTNQRGICIAVLGADCVPVLLYDAKKKIIGAIHSGWRGTTSKILGKAVQTMINHFGSNPEDIIAGIGPSIGPQSYEVGEEVILAVQKAFVHNSHLLVKLPDGKALVNLWEANRMQLLELGIPAQNIEVAGVCTYIHHDLFFSARYSKNQAGRFSAGIFLK